MKYQKYSIIYVCSFFLTIYFGFFHSQIAHAGAGSQVGKIVARQGGKYLSNNFPMIAGIFLGLVVIFGIGIGIFNLLNR